MTVTLQEAIDLHGVDVHDHLDRSDPIPVLSAVQMQGDVAVIPRRPGQSARPAVQVPAEGVPVVRGENGGNTHLLLADGNVTWVENTGRDARDLTLGTVTVADDATAFIAHPEHGYVGIAPGCYEIRRQREQADEIRLVQD